MYEEIRSLNAWFDFIYITYNCSKLLLATCWNFNGKKSDNTQVLALVSFTYFEFITTIFEG